MNSSRDCLFSYGIIMGLERAFFCFDLMRSFGRLIWHFFISCRNNEKSMNNIISSICCCACPILNDTAV